MNKIVNIIKEMIVLSVFLSALVLLISGGVTFFTLFGLALIDVIRA